MDHKFFLILDPKTMEAYFVLERTEMLAICWIPDHTNRALSCWQVGLPTHILRSAFGIIMTGHVTDEVIRHTITN